MQLINFLSLVSGLVATATATLAPGSYVVTNAISGAAVGRNHYEDMSLNPKRVQVGDPSQTISTWVVSTASNGGYNLINAGWPVGHDDNLVWACYSGDCAEQTWTLMPDVQRGPNAYVVGSKGGFGGWMVSSDPSDTQLQIGPLVAGPSMPPYFPAREVFYFTPLE